MNFEIEEKPISQLSDYGEIPIRFEVRSVFEVIGDIPASAVLVEKNIQNPWIKDYDAIKGEGPTRWPKRWDVSNWGLLVAHVEDYLVAGCVLAYNTNGVHPDYRGSCVGHRLFESAVQWARNRKCSELNIETQNINVPACRFYEQHGCRICRIDRFAYKEYPDEIQLIWSLEL